MNTTTLKRKRAAAADIFVEGGVDDIDSVSEGSLLVSSATFACDFSVENADDDEDHRCCCHGHQEVRCHHHRRRRLRRPTSNTKEVYLVDRRRRHHRHRHRRPTKTNFNVNLVVAVILTLTTMMVTTILFPLSSYALSDEYYQSSSVTPSLSSSSSSSRRHKAIIMREISDILEDHFLPLLVKQQGRNLQVVDASTKTIKERKKATTTTTAESATTTTTKDGKLVLQDPESNTEEVCEPIEGTCQQCTFSEQKSYEACVSTGRWMKYQCTSTTSSPSGDDNGNDNDQPKTRIYMRSCQYTKSDEEFAMVSCW